MAQVKYQSIFYFDIRYYNVGRYWSQSVWAENCTARDQLDIYQPLWKASRQASTLLLFNLTNYTQHCRLLGALLWRIFVTGCLVSSIDSENVLALYLKMGRKNKYAISIQSTDSLLFYAFLEKCHDMMHAKFDMAIICNIVVYDWQN